MESKTRATFILIDGKGSAKKAQRGDNLANAEDNEGKQADYLK